MLPLFSKFEEEISSSSPESRWVSLFLSRLFLSFPYFLSENFDCAEPWDFVFSSTLGDCSVFSIELMLRVSLGLNLFCGWRLQLFLVELYFVPSILCDWKYFHYSCKILGSDNYYYSVRNIMSISSKLS